MKRLILIVAALGVLPPVALATGDLAGGLPAERKARIDGDNYLQSQINNIQLPPSPKLRLLEANGNFICLLHSFQPNDGTVPAVCYFPDLNRFLNIRQIDEEKPSLLPVSILYASVDCQGQPYLSSPEARYNLNRDPRDGKWYTASSQITPAEFITVLSMFDAQNDICVANPFPSDLPVGPVLPVVEVEVPINIPLQGPLQIIMQ